MKPIKALLAVALTVTLSGPALASHYRLPVENLVTDTEATAFGKAGIQTTQALLEQIAKVDARQKLAAKSGLTFARLSALAAQVDLLRIEGVGPSMVRLLQAAGVHHTRDLKGASPSDLRDKMKVANDVQQIAPVLPQEDVLRDWIAQASRLSQVVEGLQ